MPGDIGPFEACEGTHSNIVKLREQECVDEMAAADCELRIINCFFRNLESRWSRAQKSIAASPVEFRFRLLRACDQIWQIKTEQVVAFDDVRISFFDETC